MRSVREGKYAYVAQFAGDILNKKGNPVLSQHDMAWRALPTKHQFRSRHPECALAPRRNPWCHCRAASQPNACNLNERVLGFVG